jgi:hypothetical protein
LRREGNLLKNMHQRMIIMHGEGAPSYFTMKLWSKQFQCGRESRQDDPKCERHVKPKTNENLNKVEILVLADRRIRVSMIADEVKI